MLNFVLYSTVFRVKIFDAIYPYQKSLQSSLVANVCLIFCIMTHQSLGRKVCQISYLKKYFFESVIGVALRNAFGVNVGALSYEKFMLKT